MSARSGRRRARAPRIRWADTRAAVAALALALAGCNVAHAALPVGASPPLSPEAENGRVAFDHYCNRCHPGGQAGVGPALNNKLIPADGIRFQVRHGLGAMPAFSSEVLPDAELDAIVAYLLALQKAPKAGD